MKTQNYFSQKDIVKNNIRRIDLPVRSKLDGRIISRPIICIFYPDGGLFSMCSLSLFKIKKDRGLRIFPDVFGVEFYCELRQVL